MKTVARAVAILMAAVSLPAAAQQAAEVRVAFTPDRITSTRAAGLADRTTGRAVTADDPVRVASISKLVVALGVMRLVEAGKLDLDRDVSDALGWKLRHPAHPDVPITLRLLLSHQSSLTDDAGYVVPYGRSLRAAVEAPGAWDVAHRPGSFFRYSNLNFPIIASVIEGATGERFDRVMTRVVFRPLKLDACFNWSGCSDAKVARAVVLYRNDGQVSLDDLKGKPPACPVNTVAGCDLTAYRLGENGAIFSPQGGMRISMRDLARIGQLLLKDGRGFLTRRSMNEIRTMRWRFDGTNGDTSNGFYCQYGLASHAVPTAEPGCDDELFRDGATWWGHAGEAYGLRSGLWIDPVAKRGVAFFATGVAGGAKGQSRFTAEEERLAREN